MFPFFVSLAMWSAWRIANATMVKVGFSAAPVVNWLPSETKRIVGLPPFVDNAITGLGTHPVRAKIVC